ncbi:MAG TPA: lipopolysaccharide kinase InaA family protein [Candidatus Humimicrobiaceae bacterium]|nr:lipopolysaccharide kinase InaA family protein [Candidatus Humimicrobiaceae bacterium]
MLFKSQAILSDRNFLLPDDLDSIIDGGKSFSLKKNDSSTTVGIMSGSIFGLSHDLLVKRFNYKGFFDFLFKTIFGSKARFLWDINLRLYRKGLPVPMPIAYADLSFKQKNSFYFSSVIDNSDNLGNIYKKGLFSESGELAKVLGETIAKWHLSGVVHGDLKWSNILLRKSADGYRFFLIDLDRSRIYPRPFIKGIIKDLVRFYRYGIELRADEWVDSEFLPAYMAIIPDEIKAKFDLTFIKERAWKDWYKKGQRMFSLNNYVYSFVTCNGLLINERFLEFLKRNNLADFRGLKSFEKGILLKKNRFRSVVKIELEDKILYLKSHFRPWRDGMKAIIPWLKKEDAGNEWRNMLLLNRLGFNTMTPVAFGEKKILGIPYFSLTLTESIYDAEKLETYFPVHFSHPLSNQKVFEKRELIKRIATLARDLHTKGLNHQDFYLGHLFIRHNKIFIIDIQRMHYKKSIRGHDVIKDLAQLAYSAKRSGIFTKTDFMRFAHSYLDRDKLTNEDKRMGDKIMKKLKKIARHDAKIQRKKLVLTVSK